MICDQITVHSLRIFFLVICVEFIICGAGEQRDMWRPEDLFSGQERKL